MLGGWALEKSYSKTNMELQNEILVFLNIKGISCDFVI